MKSNAQIIKSDERPLSNLELRQIQARLLAIMSRIDGKVMDVENLMAESMIELMDKKEVNALKELYDAELEKPQSQQTLEDVMSYMQDAPVQERISMLKMLSSLAICDGEFHSNEEAFMKSAMRKLSVIVQVGNPDKTQN